MTTPQQRRRRRNIALYLKKRGEHLAANPWCVRCGGSATELHHARGRVGSNLLDDWTYRSMCSPCHRYAGDHPQEAIERGWSLPRIGIADHEPGDSLLPYFGPEDEDGAA